MENITNENHTSLSESIDDRDTSSKETSSKETSSKETSSKETSSKETSSKDTSSKDMSSKDSNDDSTAQVSVSAGNDVYKTPTGKRYHLDPDCGGKNSKKTTLNEAKSFGLTPCKKCAQ